MQKISLPEGDIYQGDCLKVMRTLPKQSVDLVFGSPPYEDRRTYGDLNFDLEGEAWVAWMVKVFKASLRVCKGLVAFVVGHGKNGCRDWTAVPAMLAADLKRGGVTLRNPPIYYRHGIFGSGYTDWLRADYEWIICATNGPMELPWSNNKACGRKPMYKPGGKPSHRLPDGTRVRKMKNPSDYKDGDVLIKECLRRETDITNPGNVVKCVVGGKNLGSDIAHENEAPFPEELVRFFVLSFCPPGGVVMDPFGGSGTTAAVATKNDRRFVTCDLRESQVGLIKRRIKEAKKNKGFGAV